MKKPMQLPFFISVQNHDFFEIIEEAFQLINPKIKVRQWSRGSSGEFIALVYEGKKPSNSKFEKMLRETGVSMYEF
jgi:hypothetical protein